MNNIHFNCDYSKNEIVQTKENAIDVANYYLEQHSTTNYYKDSVNVEQYENGYQVSFKRKSFARPNKIILIVRKNDGCVATVQLK